jgi:hypothetical protein
MANLNFPTFVNFITPLTLTPEINFFLSLDLSTPSPALLLSPSLWCQDLPCMQRRSVWPSQCNHQLCTPSFLKKSARRYLVYLSISYVWAKRLEYTEDTLVSASLEICAPGGSYFGYFVFPGVMLASSMHSPESLFQTCNSFY